MAGPGELEGRRREGTNWRLWLAVAIALLALIFIALNSQEVVVDFLFAETETPLFFALLISTLLGIAIGWLAPIVRRHRRERE
jgi:lipopolysaccharide assembly protein A